MPDKAKHDDPAQSQRFIAVAREVDAECPSDKSEEHFVNLVRKDSKDKPFKDDKP